MKRLKEEKELRKIVCLPIDVDDSLNDRVADARLAGRLIAALIRAVEERCANVATGKNDACGKCAEDAEGKLCAVTEAARKYVAMVEHPDTEFSKIDLSCDPVKVANDLLAALSSTSPCRHAAIVARIGSLETFFEKEMLYDHPGDAAIIAPKIIAFLRGGGKMKSCEYCDWNTDHPYHYPDCPAIQIAALERSLSDAVTERSTAMRWYEDAATDRDNYCAIVSRIEVNGMAPVVRDATKKDGWTIQDVARALCAYLLGKEKT